MWSYLSHPFSVLFACVVLGLILLVAALSKLMDRKGFVIAVIGYEILPDSLAVLVGYALPWVELIIAGLLLSGVFASIASLGAVLLLISFSVAIGVNLLRGRELNCHCFGQLSEEKIGPWALFRNLLFSLLALEILLFNGSLFAFRPEWRGGSDWDKDAIPIVMLGIATILILALFQQASGMMRAVVSSRKPAQQQEGEV